MKLDEKELHEAREEYKRTVENVKNMDPNYVIKLSLDEQAEYADPITRKYADDKYFIDMILKNFRGVTENTSACTIGNLAYIGRHHSNEMLLTFLAKLRE